MKIDEKTVNNISILTIHGNLAMAENNDLKKFFQVEFDDSNIKGLILDLKGTEYIDSSGIGLIISMYKTLKQKEKKFILASLNDKTRELLNITKLDKILTVAQNEEKAIEMLENI